MAAVPPGPDRELQTVRQAMVDFLQNHTDANWPPACPALDPIRCVAPQEGRVARRVRFCEVRTCVQRRGPWCLAAAPCPRKH